MVWYSITLDDFINVLSLKMDALQAIKVNLHHTERYHGGTEYTVDSGEWISQLIRTFIQLLNFPSCSPLTFHISYFDNELFAITITSNTLCTMHVSLQGTRDITKHHNASWRNDYVRKLYSSQYDFRHALTVLLAVFYKNWKMYNNKRLTVLFFQRLLF